MTKERILLLTSGIGSPYYDIIKNIVHTFILGEKDKKKRCLIWTGVSDSGKSTIANYVALIFDCHNYRETKGIYDEKMSRDDTHKQVLIMDEASVHQIFAKRRLADTKLLLEGQGIAIENKFNTPFTGFVGCYTILTCNCLPFPFTLPLSSN